MNLYQLRVELQRKTPFVAKRFIDASNDMTGGASHSGMREKWIDDILMVIHNLEFMRKMPYIPNEHCDAAEAALWEAAIDIHKTEDSFVYVTDKKEVERLKSEGKMK
jgi:hypothetical protein